MKVVLVIRVPGSLDRSFIELDGRACFSRAFSVFLLQNPNLLWYAVGLFDDFFVIQLLSHKA